MNFMHEPQNQQELDKQLAKLRKYHAEMKKESLNAQGILSQDELNTYNERISSVAKKLESKLKENEQLLKEKISNNSEKKED